MRKSHCLANGSLRKAVGGHYLRWSPGKTLLPMYVSYHVVFMRWTPWLLCLALSHFLQKHAYYRIEKDRNVL